MKRLAASFSLVFLLAACGGGDGDGVACVQQYWNGAVGVCLPAGWSVLERERLTEEGMPEQVVVAFQSDQTVSGQSPTLTVTTERLPSAMDSSAYSAASIRSVTTLPGYTLVDSRSMEVEGQEVELHVFTAQPIPEQPERRFYQMSAVSGGIGYTFTALTPVAIGDTLEKQITLMMNSAGFTEPTAKE